MKRLITFFLLIIFSISLQNSFAQLKEMKSPYFAGMLGTSTVTFGEHDRSQNPAGSTFGAGFGFPVSKQLSIFSQLMYLSQSDFTAYEVLNYSRNGVSINNELTELNASFSQLIYNLGLEYNFFLSEQFKLGINGGFSYSLINQEASLPSGQLISKLNNDGVFGYFGGANLEKGFTDSNFSLFIEAQYNYANKDAVFYRTKFSGMNYMFGIKYYLGG